MPWTIHIDPDVNCAFCKFYGAFDIGQLGNAAGEIYNHPDYRAGMNTLRDTRDQIIPSNTSFKSLSNEAKKIMHEFDAKLDNCRLAIVAGDGQSYSKIHQYILGGRLSKSPVERKAFRDIDKVKVWLGLPEDYEINYPAPEETT